MRKALKVAGVPALRDEYRKAVKRIRLFEPKLTPTEIRAYLTERLARQGVAKPTPAQWVWEAEVYAADLHEGYCEGAAVLAQEGDWRDEY